HSTKPAGMERAAEPDPRRARTESSGSVRSSPAALLPATANAANAAAEEAIPAPAGKLFSLVTSAFSLIFAIPRTRSRMEETRASPFPETGLELMSRLSVGRDAENVTVVRVNNPSRFIEMEPLTG